MPTKQMLLSNPAAHNKGSKAKFYILIGIVTLLVIGGLFALPYLNELGTPEGRAYLINMIQSNGIVGAIGFVLIQIIQVVIFILPGEVVEVAGGMIYGTVNGFFLCSLGTILGSAIIYYLVKWLGYDFITQIISEEKFSKFKFLQNDKKLSLLVFILFFIPGTPKDALVYFIPFTNMKLSKFLVISTVARIPSIVSSTFAGASLQSGNIGLSLIIFVVIGLVGIVGIYINKKLLDRKNK